jgi:inner membrane protein
VIAHALFGHRGLLHSLLALAILILGLGLFRVPTEFIACVALGYASHLLLDALTPSGIPALYPAPARLRLSPFLKIKTGGLVDQLLFLLFSLGLVGLVALAAQTFSLPKPYA